MTTTTRSKRDPEGRKRAIIDATVELITELDINDVNHRKIAERAGVPLGATTQYFASKGDLIRSALEQMEAECDRDLAQLDADLELSVDRVRTLAAFFLHYLDDTEKSRTALAFYNDFSKKDTLGQLSDLGYSCKVKSDGGGPITDAVPLSEPLYISYKGSDYSCNSIRD